MADDNGRNDVKSLAERQRNMVEVSDHFIKGSAVLAIAAFIFTGGMATVGKGGIWLAMGLSMVLTAVLVSVLGLMTLVRVVAVFETLIQSDPGESRLHSSSTVEK